MIIETIDILGGVDRGGGMEGVERISLSMGQVASVVGPTGSGKTALITDIELFANGDTPTKRKILINNAPPPQEWIDRPSCNPVAIITQHTNFLSDLPVCEFLKIHARTRKSGEATEIKDQTLAFANRLTGEPIDPKNPMTQLSGGQTRALLIADAVVIGKSPILLLDEIENAGINKTRTLELLKQQKKIFIFVTHDPRIALLSDFRIVMAGGAMKHVIRTSEKELGLALKIAELDDLAFEVKRKLWNGESLIDSEPANQIGAAILSLQSIAGSFAPAPQESFPITGQALIDRAVSLGRAFQRR